MAISPAREHRTPHLAELSLPYSTVPLPGFGVR